MLTPALRVEASLHRLGYLRAEIFDWTQRRQKLDKREQFVTQLASLQATLDSALDRLSAKASGFAPRSAAEAYDLGREFDNRLVIVRRLWRWFADKFDQRDVDQLAKTLSAADEVVWSIHAGIMRAVHDGEVPAPAPLPYIDEVGAPEAIPRDLPPQDLRLTDYDEALQVILARLPIPVIGLGADTRKAPWELALLGHEVGHHLQYDLLPERQLVESVGKAVATAVGDEEAGAQWRWWSRELFADLSGLITIGPSSLTALLPLEYGAERHMFDRERGRYPAPVVRLSVIAAMAAKLGLDVADAMQGTDAVTSRASASIRADLDHVPQVAAALVGCKVSGEDTLATLSGFSARAFARHGDIWDQADQLMRSDKVAERGIHVARNLASAGVVAWQQLIAIADRTERDDKLATLSTVLVDNIIDSAEQETRGVDTNISKVSVGAEVADILVRGLEF